jgi:hypothetical protein
VNDSHDTKGEDTIEVPVTVRIPRSSLLPNTVSQKTSLEVFGLPSKAFLALLRRDDCDVGVTCLGRLRVVDREEMAKWIRKKAIRIPAVKPLRVDIKIASSGTDPVDEFEAAMIESGLRKTSKGWTR